MEKMTSRYTATLSSNDGVTIRSLGNDLRKQINGLLNLLEIEHAGAIGRITDNQDNKTVFSCSKSAANPEFAGSEEEAA